MRPDLNREHSPLRTKSSASVKVNVTISIAIQRIKYCVYAVIVGAGRNGVTEDSSIGAFLAQVACNHKLRHLLM